MIDWDKFVYGIVRIDELVGQGLRYRLWRQDDTTPGEQYILAGQPEVSKGGGACFFIGNGPARVSVRKGKQSARVCM